MNYEELIVLIRDPNLDVGILMTGAVHDITDRSLLPVYLGLDKDTAEKFVLNCCKHYEEQGTDPSCLDFKVARTATGISFMPTGVLH